MTDGDGRNITLYHNRDPNMFRAQHLENGWSRSAQNLGKYIEIKYKVGQVDRVDRRGAESSWVVRRAKSRVDQSSWSVFVSDRSSKVDSIDFGVIGPSISETAGDNDLVTMVGLTAYGESNGHVLDDITLLENIEKQQI